jgi:hypothetical protein
MKWASWGLAMPNLLQLENGSTEKDSSKLGD